MAISGVGSWLPTIDEFLEHWRQVLGSAGNPTPNLAADMHAELLRLTLAD